MSSSDKDLLTQVKLVQYKFLIYSEYKNKLG
jgi:hypothetical protein